MVSIITSLVYTQKPIVKIKFIFLLFAWFLITHKRVDYSCACKFMFPSQNSTHVKPLQGWSVVRDCLFISQPPRLGKSHRNYQLQYCSANDSGIFLASSYIFILPQGCGFLESFWVLLLQQLHGVSQTLHTLSIYIYLFQPGYILPCYRPKQLLHSPIYSMNKAYS